MQLSFQEWIDVVSADREKAEALSDLKDLLIVEIEQMKFDKNGYYTAFFAIKSLAKIGSYVNTEDQCRIIDAVMIEKNPNWSTMSERSRYFNKEANGLRQTQRFPHFLCDLLNSNKPASRKCKDKWFELLNLPSSIRCEHTQMEPVNWLDLQNAIKEFDWDM